MMGWRLHCQPLMGGDQSNQTGGNIIKELSGPSPILTPTGTHGNHIHSHGFSHHLQADDSPARPLPCALAFHLDISQAHPSRYVQSQPHLPHKTASAADVLLGAQHPICPSAPKPITQLLQICKSHPPFPTSTDCQHQPQPPSAWIPAGASSLLPILVLISTGGIF